MATNYSPRAVTDGLILCLDAANVKSYPGTGSNWSDLTNTLSDATKAGSNSPTYPLWHADGYFIFQDGTVGDNFNRFDVALPAMTSISVLAIWRSRTTGGHVLRLDNSDVQIGADGYTAGTSYNDIQIVPSPALVNNLDDWQIGQLSFNGQDLIAYTNGVSEGTESMVSPDPDGIIAGTLRIGTRNDAYTNHLDGDIALISIYDKALSVSEIQQNFNAFRGRFGL